MSCTLRSDDFGGIRSLLERRPAAAAGENHRHEAPAPPAPPLGTASFEFPSQIVLIFAFVFLDVFLQIIKFWSSMARLELGR